MDSDSVQDIGDTGLQEMDDALRDMQQAGTDEDNERRWIQQTEARVEAKAEAKTEAKVEHKAEAGTERSKTQDQTETETEEETERQAMERLAYRRGFNPIADSNVQMEAEDRQRQEKRRQAMEQDEERNAKARVENRVYALGTAALKFPVANCMAVRCARNAVEHAVRESMEQTEAENRRIREAGEKKLRWETKREDVVRQQEQKLTETALLVVTLQQALSETMAQAEAFADHEDVDTGRIAVMDPHYTVVEGEQLLQLVREGSSVLSIPEVRSRTLYPYSFGRPSKALISVLRCTVELVHRETGSRIARESFSVIDRHEEETAKQRTAVVGPSVRREEPLVPVAHTNRIEIAIDMTGNGHTRAEADTEDNADEEAGEDNADEEVEDKADRAVKKQ